MNPLAAKLLATVKTITDGSREIVDRNDLVRASVLLSIVFRGPVPHMVLTKRTMTVAKHKGQISFPGGTQEPEDANAVETALREAHEEIGLRKSDVHLAGMLDDFITITGFVVTPVVGIIDEHAAMIPDPTEVAELFEVPFSVFLDPASHEILEGGIRFHRYRYRRYDIWGATAGIIYRFFEALEKADPMGSFS